MNDKATAIVMDELPDPPTVGRRFVHVSRELLEQILLLPSGVEIETGQFSDDGRTLKLRLASADFPPVAEGCPYPVFDALYRRDRVDDGKPVYETKFDGWRPNTWS